MTIAEQIAAHFAQLPNLEPTRTAVYFEDKEVTWGRLGEIADTMLANLASAKVPDGASVGWIARNDPALLGAVIGLIKGWYTVSPVNPHQPTSKIVEQLRTLRMAAIVGVEQDFSPEVLGVLAEIEAVGIIVDAFGTAPARFAAATTAGAGPYRKLDDAIIERLTSGTTGEPKRIMVPAATFQKALELGARSETDKKGEPLKVKRSPSILQTTFSHSGGLWGALLALNQARPVFLFEKFVPSQWADAVHKGQVKAGNLVPSMITMVLESDIPREKIASLMVIRAGTAPLDPDTQRRFEEKYGIPVLTEYSASEFMGGIAGWSLADHRIFGESKRGAAGTLRPDMQVKITDVETGEELPRGQIGVLNLKSPRIGPDFIKTTDLASFDEDDFLWIHGRADEAINRGGFKILPEKVAEVLRLHANVREAGVLAVKDARLGQVPVAFVELVEPGKTTESELKEQVRANMPAYMVPTAIEIVPALPRTLSMKVDRPALRAQFSDTYRFA